MKYIQRPTLLIDSKKAKENIEEMLEKTNQANTEFRPHFKTHQSVYTGEMFRKMGIEKITVSSVSMAELFMKRQWKDITIAFPINILEINKINAMSKVLNLNVLIESYEKAELLYDILEKNMGIWIEVDTGYNRSGISIDNKNEIAHCIKFLKKKGFNRIEGLLTHAGESYGASQVSDNVGLFNDLKKRLIDLKDFCVKESGVALKLSYGDTPTLSVNNDFGGFDEVRPGNFVYYDLMQYLLKACHFDNIAVAVACPVVSFAPERNEMIIYGGAVHFSKENRFHPEYGTVYGLIAIGGNGLKWKRPLSGAYLKSLSQEHGIVNLPPELSKDFKIGDLVKVIPVHSCLTVDCFMKNNDRIYL